MPDFDSKEFANAARAALDAQEASEIVRRYQQGFGRPIVSLETNGFRIVAVGKSVKWSKEWRFFTDFLLDHLKDTIGRPWAIQAQREGKSHPIFTWLETINAFAANNRTGGQKFFQSLCKGHLGALWRLGYALYLVEHNDHLDQKIIKRLRSPISFRPTYHETQIVASFAVSGFQIKMAEIKRSSQPTPEFWATRGDGQRYSIEAKCKNLWNNQQIIDSKPFKSELRQWIRNQLYASSKKRLNNAVYCFELSISENFDAVQWNQIASEIRNIIKESENIKIDGAAPCPAYVIVTNNVDVLRDQEFECNRVAMLFGFCMSDWPDAGVSVDIETALERHDKHRDIHTIFKCFEEIDEIPQSFDGSPIMLDERGSQMSIEVKIGSKIEYPDSEGNLHIGNVYDVTSANEEVWVCVETDGQHNIIKMPLLPHEIDAVRKYGDAVFGKRVEKRRDLGGDPMKFYDWIISIYETYDRKALLVQIQDHIEYEEFSKLPTNELRVRAAREVTKAAVASSGRPRQV